MRFCVWNINKNAEVELSCTMASPRCFPFICYFVATSQKFMVIAHYYERSFKVFDHRAVIVIWIDAIRTKYCFVKRQTYGSYLKIFFSNLSDYGKWCLYLHYNFPNSLTLRLNSTLKFSHNVFHTYVDSTFKLNDICIWYTD